MNDDAISGQLPAAGALAAETPAGALAFTGAAGQLTPLVIRNAVLNLLTLTLFRFWGKTDVRRYLWRNIHLYGEPLEYTGTGKELFVGFLVVLFLILLPLGAITQGVPQFLPFSHPAAIAIGVLTYPAIMFLVGIAIYRARRYRLTRTLWRGIRGRLTGSPVRYGLMYLGCFLLTIATLGMAYPWCRVQLFGRLIEDTAYGEHAFQVERRARPLYATFIVAVVLGLVFILIGLAVFAFLVFGLVMNWSLAGADNLRLLTNDSIHILVFTLLFYAVLSVAAVLPLAYYRSREYDWFARITMLGEIGFRFDVNTWAMARLYLGNVLIWIFTLGLGHPFVQMRNFNFMCRNLMVLGDPDIEAIRQSVADNPKYGEGLADAFDVDFF
jgi:uncharacterized membrane protein YjgN (DUF898 family)